MFTDIFPYIIQYDNDLYNNTIEIFDYFLIFENGNNSQMEVSWLNGTFLDIVFFCMKLRLLIRIKTNYIFLV